MTRMKDVNHTNPTDPRNVFGELFRRGPSTVADGGTPTGTPQSTDDVDAERDAAAERDSDAETDESSASTKTAEQMKDISHTAADEDRNPNRVWSRGSEDEVQEE